MVRSGGIEQIHRKIRNDDQFADQIAWLFLEGRESAQLVQHIADFYLEQLSLPDKWLNLISDATLTDKIVRKKLAGEYADKKGEYVEKLVANTIQELAP